ncbi:MAG: lysine-sensitive aspartokinase 3 [Bdellovibrionaceae bacterium]|nr:lysine-sensitive aspartokinase 3 [Pseudobdellovibrionaceae bacterium]
MKKIVVSKFGGTSMGDAQCMKRSAQVSLSQNASLVVVSATSGTTNLLIALGHKALSYEWPQLESLIADIRKRHLVIADELKLETKGHTALTNLFQELESIVKGVFYLKDLSLKALDTLQSLGERMSSVLFTQAMANELASQNRRAILYDAREILKTDDLFGKAKPNQEWINQHAPDFFSAVLKTNDVGVAQGFIGSTVDGHTTTLGRGGSDFSAAILAEGINADILEIWTDVTGILTTDPRLVKEAKVINEISFKEASELATFGAKVLHPATLLPAIRKNIPVFVGSSFDANKGGTWVRKDVELQPLIRAMALRRKQVLVTLSTPEMLQTHGFLFHVFTIFNDHKVSVDAITTSEISVSMTLDETTLQNKDLFKKLEAIAEVHIEDGLSLVSLIGNNIIHTSGLAKKIFESIPEINVRMICLGASKHNFCFLVKDTQAEEALKRLHKTFIA